MEYVDVNLNADNLAQFGYDVKANASAAQALPKVLVGQLQHQMAELERRLFVPENARRVDVSVITLNQEYGTLTTTTFAGLVDSPTRACKSKVLLVRSATTPHTISGALTPSRSTTCGKEP